MATVMSEGRTSVLAVVLSDAHGSLRSTVFASREGLVTVRKLDDVLPQQAVSVHLKLDLFRPDDFVVRSVLAGNRRKLEILASDTSGFVFRRLMQDIAVPRRNLPSQKLIEFADGPDIVEVPNAVIVATYKGK